MSLNLDKSSWKPVFLGDVALASKEKVDPTRGDVDRYVAGEHMDTDNLKLSRWGEVRDIDLGPAFHRRFRPGQVLYGSRRTYLRKVAVSEFDGVCANTTFVLEPSDPRVLSPRFLPLIMSSEPFHAFAIAESKGSVNPYVNWSDIARYEFLLPSLDEQKRLADLLWAQEQYRVGVSELADLQSQVEDAWTLAMLANLDVSIPLYELIDPSRPLCYGVVQPGNDVEGGVGLIRVMDLQAGEPTRSSLKQVSPEIDEQYRRSRVAAGDVLVSIVGTIGRTWTVTDEFEGCNIARALARIAPNTLRVIPEFLEWVLSSSQVQTALDTASFESARKTLNLSALVKMLLPYAELSHQRELLDQRASIRVASGALASELSNLSALRSAILASIFGGA